MKEKINIIALLFLVLVNSQLLMAQNTRTSESVNLVLNSGFEEIEKETNGQAYMENVKYWYNANKKQNTPLYGTPDHMYAAQRNNGTRRNDAYFEPYEGLSTAGVITYMQRVRDYREYISVRLNQELQIGSTYEVSFYLTNGSHTAFGNIGTNGFGALLTETPVEQKVYEPINEKPQFMLEEIFYDTDWQKITFKIKADKAYRYLTLGNFIRDYQIKKRYYYYDVDPQSYFYIDDVSVVEKNQEEVFEEPEPVVTKQVEIPKEEPLEGRNVNVQNRFKIKKGVVTIKVWDRKEVDGDVISLRFNDQWILQNYSLKKRKKKVKVNYQSNNENILIFFAHNLGEEPPSTAAVSLKSGKEKRVMNIQSDMKYCGAIQFIR
ncbi:hypothetical protein [Chondrinema litorale]|uniref:hypothetical protein n=1 Tax=Chondrinema litorale TaxID=2994555 RepID=UPI002542B44A|nr:hypothetical protein [Chondrinema litorale]UZR93369.1 hypothetical protein OQ292_16060 [Chondrinema litorale]